MEESSEYTTKLQKLYELFIAHPGLPDNRFQCPYRNFLMVRDNNNERFIWSFLFQLDVATLLRYDLKPLAVESLDDLKS